MRAVKRNKQYAITERDIPFYTAAGYDVVDDDGAVVEYARNKMIPYGEYVKALASIETLRAENETLRAENAALRAKKKPAGKSNKEADANAAE